MTVKLKAVPAVSVTDAALVKAGALATVSVNAWLVVPVEFCAEIVIGYGPLAVAAAVPAIVAVPFVLAVNVMPEGSVPAWLRVGVGVPVVVTVKLNALPEVAVAEFALVIAKPLLTVRAKLCVAVPDELLAVMVTV
jgi:hypothetical protein